MARLFWNSSEMRGKEPPAFKPDDYGDILERLVDVFDMALELRSEQEREGADAVYVPIRAGGRRTGWCVMASGDHETGEKAAQLAAEMLGRQFTADQDIASLALEVTDRYEELNFLYNMGDRVGGLLDETEICEFVVEEAAWLMSCDRASIMVPHGDDAMLHIAAAVGLPEHIRAKVSVKPGEGISGKVFESGHGIIVNEGDPMPGDALGTRSLRQSNCFLSVPLKINTEGGQKEKVVGVFNLTRKRSGEMFTASDLKLVSAVASTAATQIHNCRLLEAERERQRLEHELELAARIQLSLLPKEPLCRGAVQVGGYCKPAARVGGDLFDYWMQGETLCLVQADVSGHDMGAALMATALRSVMRSETAHRQSVSGLMAQVNRALFEDLCNAELFISVFYGEVNLQTGLMTYCRAGHPLPLLVGPEREDWLDTEGMLFGILEDGGFGEATVQLQQGEAIVFYTDGLVECGASHEEFFGTDGVQKAAKERLGQDSTCMAEGIVQAARDYAGELPIADDMTAMVLRLAP